MDKPANCRAPYVAMMLFIMGLVLFAVGFYNIHTIADGYPANEKTDAEELYHQYYWTTSGAACLVVATIYSIYSGLVKYRSKDSKEDTIS